MRASIQTKLLVMCVLLVLLTAVSISATYYILAKQAQHRESQQRIRIAFDIILDDINNRLQSYSERFDDLLKQDSAINWLTRFYNQNHGNLASKQFILSSLSKMGDVVKNFGSLISTDYLTIYGADKRLLVVYKRIDEEHGTVGGYVISETGKDSYLAMDDFSKLSDMFSQKQAIPDTSLPDGVSGFFEGEDIPDAISASLFSKGSRIGLRIVAPISIEESKEGTLVGEVFLTQPLVERYASLSETGVNFFVGDQFSLGTLSAQAHVGDDNSGKQSTACETLLSKTVEIDVEPVQFGEQAYYQGQCALQSDSGRIGAITVSLSQEIEKREIKKIMTAVLSVSGVVTGVAFILSLLFSRKAIHAIQSVVNVIVAAAEGDLRKTAAVMTHDEFGRLATKLNQMITQLRNMSGEVQNASYAVNATADTILQQMKTLIRHMEQQSSSVENTTIASEHIRQFIDVVAHNTDNLLSAASQILSSIQEIRASIEEVTGSTSSLTANLHLISSSVEQVDGTVKQISGDSGQLEDVARQTETEALNIDQALQNVSQNATQAKQLARTTMEAATNGQFSVEASIEGIMRLKKSVSHTAQIIEEVNRWGEQVSSILDIVDEITEQTSLLALNASIISAQAGTHGKGFAVVADEIKNLAIRTKASTQKIGTLVHELQMKTGEGVRHIAEGITKADEGVHLVSAVKDALTSILDSATRSSNRAEDTARVIQETVQSSQAISASMGHVTDMVSHIRTALQKQARDVEQVVSAVENISGMSEQVNRANIEQKRAVEEIEESMVGVTEQFSNMSEQTGTLQHNAEQIVEAMHIIDSTTENILQNATDISGKTVQQLIQQSDVLHKIVGVFKV